MQTSITIPTHIGVAQSSPSRRLIFGDMWLALALMVRAATRSEVKPMAVILRDDGTLEALAPSHPSYVASVTLPGFVCMISQASHPYRIAARIRTAVERSGAATGHLHLDDIGSVEAARTHEPRACRD